MALFDFPPERPKGLLGFIPEVEAQVPADPWRMAAPYPSELSSTPAMPARVPAGVLAGAPAQSADSID